MQTHQHGDELTVIQVETRAPGIPISAPKDPADAARWRAGVASRKAASLGTSVGDYERSPLNHFRAILSVDGNAGCALLGENLQEGEAEFVVVEQRKDEPLHEAEVRACWEAFKKLKERLGRDLTYAWYPRRPGSAGA